MSDRDEVAEVLAKALRSCRVEDGSPASLIREGDIGHATHMTTEAMMPLLARREAEARAAGVNDVVGRVEALHAPEFWRIGKTRVQDRRIDGETDGAPGSTRTHCKYCHTEWPCETVAALAAHSDQKAKP